MSIVKVSRKNNPFVMIEKSIFDDNTISWAAKGIMGYLLSKTGDWNVNVADIVNHSPMGENGQKRRGNGEEAIYKILKELRLNRYAHHEFKRNEKGIVVGSEWTVFENKQPYRANPDTAEPDTAEPDGVQPDHNNNEYSNNESNNNKSKPKDAPQSDATPQKEYSKQSQVERLRSIYKYAQEQKNSMVTSALSNTEFRELWTRYIVNRTSVHKKKYKTVFGEYTQINNFVKISTDKTGLNMALAEKIFQQTRGNDWVALIPLKAEDKTQNNTPAPAPHIPVFKGGMSFAADLG